MRLLQIVVDYGSGWKKVIITTADWFYYRAGKVGGAVSVGLGVSNTRVTRMRCQAVLVSGRVITRTGTVGRSTCETRMPGPTTRCMAQSVPLRQCFQRLR